MDFGDDDDEERDLDTCAAMAEFCCRYPDAMNEREASFVRQMRAKLVLGGGYCTSPKQKAWLEIIYGKLSRRRR